MSAAPRQEEIRCALRHVSTGMRAAVAMPLLLLAACADPATPPDAAPAMATVSAVEGQAFLRQSGRRAEAAVGAALGAGDALETGNPGKMRLELGDASTLAIGAGTKLELDALELDGGSRSGRLRLAAGRFWMQVTKWTGAGPSHWEIATPSAVAGVRGTTLWGDTEADAICALEGRIEVRSLAKDAPPPVELAAGHCASALSEGKLAPLEPSAADIERYLDEVLIRSAP